MLKQFSGGAFGAFHICTATGDDAVLKLLPNWPEYALHRVKGAADIVHGLIADGYPAPRFFDVGAVKDTVYSVQEYVSARAPERLPGAAPATLLELCRRHEAVLTNNAGSEWGAEIIARIDRVDELRHRTSDKRILGIIDRALETARNSDPRVFRTNDVVHGDFHPGNVLVRGDAVAAVIDWESARPGDSRADLIRMYSAMASWSHPGSTLFREELDRTTPPEVWRPIAAELTALHLRYALLVQPDELDWVLREADILLGRS
ncbi:MAG TPA: aminoglycoside phosphotransferase family protein [Mycobacteriales bacterium]|nr:aminoglycoside phosphotransferase family protein [Mycobacteriales bacterium]